MVACQGKLLLIVAPMPRYWLSCCDKMEGVSLPSAADQDRRRLLRDLGNLRRAIIGRVMKLKASRWVHLFNPLEALNLDDCVADIEQVMKDSCHLLPACYRVLAEDVVRYWEESKASKRSAEMPMESRSKVARIYKAAPRRGHYVSDNHSFWRLVLVGGGGPPPPPGRGGGVCGGWLGCVLGCWFF
jgi:hypothetical protein